MQQRYRLKRSTLTQATLAALAMAVAASAAAQSSTPANASEQEATQQDEAKRLEAVQVVGSRIKRTQVEGPSPVTVISSEQIRAEGFNTVQDVLETLSQNTGGTQNDFNSAGGFTPNAGVINLRGMGPGRTLLLINGRRANDYPFPYNGRSNVQNFNNIPAGAVDRIEVLAGGASAIYGSDAVAGVINVVLKTNYEGNQISLKGQTATQGGRDIGDLQWVGGKTGDRWSLTYAFEAYSSEPLWAWQRDFMDSAQDNPAPPGVNGAAGVGGYQPPIGIQIRRQSSTGATLAYIQPTGRNCSASGFYRPHTYSSSVSGATFGPGCGYDRSPAEQTVANGNNDVSAYLYGTFDFSEGLQGWASFMTFDSTAKLSGGVEQWFGGPQPNGVFYDPGFGMRIFPIRTLTTESYGGSEGTFQRFDETSYDLAFGLKGAFGDRFDWDFTIGGARYEAYRQRPRLTVAGSSAFFLGDRLGTTGQGPYTGLVGINNGLPVYRLNLDRFYGAITPADYAAMSTTVTYDAVAKNAAATFVVSGSLFEMPAGDLGMAVVAEASTQSYTLDTDRRLLPDRREIYNLTGTGGGGDRDRFALGAEFSIPLLDSLTMTLAGRFDRYDDITDVDDAKTWNGGLEWRPFEDLLVRGSYSTSFKAPDMHYVFAERSGSFGTVTDFSRCARDAIAPNLCSGAGANYNYSVFTTSQGQPTLEEETGKSWTAGVVWDITDALSATVDYYRIDLKNVITVRSGTDIIGDEYGCATGLYPNQTAFPFAPGSDYCNAVISRITRDANSDNRLTEVRSGPINLAFQGTKGIDASLRYRWDAGEMGAFSASVSWSHVLEQTDRATPAAALRNYRDLNTNADYRSRGRATLGWAKDEWTATVFMSRLGTFPIWDPTNARAVSGELDSRIAAFTTYNLTVGRQITDDFGLTLSVVNVFDKNYPSDPTFNSFPYFWRAYDALGRQIGIEANYKF